MVVDETRLTRYDKYVAHMTQEDCDSLVPNIYWKQDAWVCLGRKMFATSKLGPDIAYAAWESALFDKAWAESETERKQALWQWLMRKEEEKKLKRQFYERQKRNAEAVLAKESKKIFVGRTAYRNVTGGGTEGHGYDPLPNVSCWQILDAIRDYGIEMQDWECLSLLNQTVDWEDHATLH